MQPLISTKKILFFGLAALIIIVTITPSIYFYSKYQETRKLLQDPSSIADKEAASLITKVSKIIVLPENETPQISTVTKKEDLTNQVFFAKAENGDKALLFTNSKKAYLYRPSANKIINVASPDSLPNSLAVNNIAAPSPTPTATASPTSPPKPQDDTYNVYLYNGTTKVGLTVKYETILKKSAPTAVVVDRDNAKSKTYAKTIIIDLTDSKDKELNTLSKALNIPSSKLPDGEAKPDGADFLIILGSDKSNI